MINGIYAGATALDNYSKQQELIASNLAHLNTPGHRREFYTFQEKTNGADDNPIAMPGASVRTKSIDFSAGPKKATGRALDVAINGEGFFVYQGGEEQLYSRNGVLFRSPEGTLVNSDGLAILDNGSPIQIPNDVSHYDLVIDSSGQISANGATLGQLSMVEFDNPQLLNSESKIYFTSGDAVASPAEDTTVLQGSRELANAHPVTELISLIVGSRHFEAAQRAIRTLSDTIQENTRS